MLTTLIFHNSPLEEIEAYLQNDNVEINEVDANGFTPLTLAVNNGDRPLTKSLLKYGAKIDGRKRTIHGFCSDVDGYTPLMIAIKNKDHQMVNLLINDDANVNKRIDEAHGEGMTVLILACLTDESKIIKLLLDCYADMGETYDNMTPLIISCKYGLLEAVNMLLEQGVSVHQDDNCGQNPVFSVLISSEPIRIDILHLLLKYHPRLSRNTCKGEVTSLHYLAQHTHDISKERFKTILEATRLLVASGANIDQSCYSINYSPLLTAVHHNARPEFIQLLINLEANINRGDSEGKTALMLAAECGYEPLVKLLVEAGANVNKLNYHKRTALTYAIKSGNLEIVKMILKAGADPNVIFPIKKNLELTKILLEGGAKIDFFYEPLDEKTRTKLVNCSKELVTLLQENGLEIDRIRDNKVQRVFLIQFSSI